jgi:hypothetical protein
VLLKTADKTPLLEIVNKNIRLIKEQIAYICSAIKRKINYQRYIARGVLVARWAQSFGFKERRIK